MQTIALNRMLLLLLIPKLKMHIFCFWNVNSKRSVLSPQIACTILLQELCPSAIHSHHCEGHLQKPWFPPPWPPPPPVRLPSCLWPSPVPFGSSPPRHWSSTSRRCRTLYLSVYAPSTKRIMNQESSVRFAIGGHISQKISL